MPTLRINMWSGPRNISTALMYSFAQRQDTRVVDEPLYAHYLRISKAPHPGVAEVLAAMENDGERVIRDVILGPCDRPILFMKQMAHHLTDLNLDFLAVTTNVLLIRSPEEMLPSLAQNLPAPTLRDTGLAIQSDLYRHLCELGQDPPVLDAKQVLLNPEGVLSRLCARLQIPFDRAMLSWPPGPRPEDGVWAKYWYYNLHRSSCFEPYRQKREQFPPRLAPLLDECWPYYENLAKVAL
jgi:hypothetical protein